MKNLKKIEETAAAMEASPDVMESESLTQENSNILTFKRDTPDLLSDEMAPTSTQETDESEVNPDAAETSSEETRENDPEENQDSSGVLTGQDEISRYRNVGWATEEIPIDQIFHFTLIPDYFLPTEADRPIVARTPNGHFCLDGWDLIEMAKSKGSTAIVVDVDNIQAHSDEELCLRKIALRINTRGTATYAEIIRNSRDTFQMLLNTNEDLKVFSHGGRRDREGLAGNKEDDAVEILSRRIRMDRDTINTHLRYSKYLSDVAIQIFIEKEATKRFFENMQVKKRILEKNLIGEKRTLVEITEAVSSFMLATFEIFQKNPRPGKSGNTLNTSASQIAEEDQPSTAEENTTTGDIEGENEYLVTEDNISDIDPENIPEQSITIETIKTGVQGISVRLAEFATKDIPLVEIENSLKAELKIIMELLNMVNSLSTAGK